MVQNYQNYMSWGYQRKRLAYKWTFRVEAAVGSIALIGSYQI